MKIHTMRQRVPEFTSESDERMKILVKSCISEVDRTGVRGSRKCGAARPWEGGGMQATSWEEK